MTLGYMMTENELNNVLTTTNSKVSLDGNWVTFRLNNYKVYAEVFLTPSHFGIGKDLEKNWGRISKLEIRTSDNKTIIVHYDRGWDVRPESEDHIELLKKVLQFFPYSDE